MRVENDFLDQKRRQGDEEADNIIANVVKNGTSRLFYSYLSLSKDEAGRHEPLEEVRDFLMRPAVYPDWFDESRLLNGQRFFQKYALDVMGLLGALSLPYCYAATPGNKAN
jgi:hypothetical protein